MENVSQIPPIILCGATGRTGNAIAHALALRSDISLYALVSPSVASRPTRPLPEDIPSYARLEDVLNGAPENAVIVDLTHADPARIHMALALETKHHFVLGATGLSDAEIREFGTRFASAKLGLFQVPNFSIGAVLGMRVAQMLAEYFPSVSIIETHHDGKRDAPSGTAVHTAKLIAAARSEGFTSPHIGTDSASLGENIDGIPVHAVRLPGATAHQEVIFGAPGELLTIRHDAIDRSCYADGVVHSVRAVGTMIGLTVGLENAL